MPISVKGQVQQSLQRSQYHDAIYPFNIARVS